MRETLQVLLDDFVATQVERRAAEVLGCSVGTVKSQASRALAALRIACPAPTTEGPLPTLTGANALEEGPVAVRMCYPGGTAWQVSRNALTEKPWGAGRPGRHRPGAEARFEPCLQDRPGASCSATPTAAPVSSVPNNTRAAEFSSVQEDGVARRPRRIWSTSSPSDCCGNARTRTHRRQRGERGTTLVSRSHHRHWLDWSLLRRCSTTRKDTEPLLLDHPGSVSVGHPLATVTVLVSQLDRSL